MKGINLSRVLLGGLAAGVVINLSEFVLNGVVVIDEMEAFMASKNLTYAGWAMPAFVIIGFVFGGALAWLYAALRPRYGAGWMTGARAGAAIWVLGYVVPAIWFGTVGLTASMGTTLLVLVWGLVEVVLAGAVAGWLYQEEAATAKQPVHAGM